MKKVTILYDFLIEPGGLERVILTQTKFLRANKFMVINSYATIDRQLCKKPPYDSLILNEHTLKLLKLPALKIIFSFLFPSVLNTFRDVDLFISHSFICTRLAHKMKKKFGIPYVVFLHHPPHFLYFSDENKKEWAFGVGLGRIIALFAGLVFNNSLKRMDKKVVRGADKVLVNSEYTQKRIKQIYGVNSYVIYPTLNEKFCLKKKDEIKYIFKKYNLKKQFIFSCGRIFPDKKFDWLLESFAHFCKKNTKFNLIISGYENKKYRKYLDNTVKKFGLSKTVRFLKFISEEDLVALYNNAEVFVLSAPKEDFGLVPIEAMACGTPVVAWDDSAGPKETVIPDINGLLAKPYDTKDFANKLDISIEGRFKENNRDKIIKSVEQFSEKVQKKKFVKIINKLVN